MRHVLNPNTSCGKPSTSILREQLMRAPVVVHSDIQVSPPTINLVTPVREDVEINFEPMEVDDVPLFELDRLEELLELIHEDLRDELGVPITANEVAHEAQMVPEEIAPVAAVEAAEEVAGEGAAGEGAAGEEAAGEEAAAEGAAAEEVLYEVNDEETAPEPAIEDEGIPNDGLDGALGEAFDNQRAPPQEHHLLFQKLLADIGESERQIKEKKAQREDLERQLREVEKELKEEESNLQKKRATKVNLENLVSTKIKHEKIRDAANVKIRKIRDELFGKR